MEQFVDDDSGYLLWLEQHQDQHVLNTYRSPRPDYLRLHRADCGLISGTPANGEHWTMNYIKLCGSRVELEQWVKTTVGADTWACERCLGQE